MHHVAALSEAREEAYDAVLHSAALEAVGSDAGRALDDVVARARRHPFDDTRVDDLAARALEKRWRRVAGVHDRVADMSPAERHRVRIEAKKLRYGCEFFAGAVRRRRRAARSSPTTASSSADPSRTPGTSSRCSRPSARSTTTTRPRSLLRSVGAGAPAVDEAALVEEGVAACHRLAAVEPFWR